KGKAVEGEVIILPDFKDSSAFQAWLPQVKGKYVMVSMYQPTGRPDHNWNEFARPETFEKMKAERDELLKAYNDNIRATGLSANSLPGKLEDAGALGVLSSFWSREFGAN